MKKFKEFCESISDGEVKKFLPGEIKIVSSDRDEKKAFFRGHEITLERETEEDNVKWRHSVKLPNTLGGKTIIADISPYDSTFETVALWLLAGMPKRKGVAPFDREQLMKLAKEKLPGPTDLNKAYTGEVEE